MCTCLFVDHHRINVFIYVLNFRNWFQPQNYFNSEIFLSYGILPLALLSSSISQIPHLVWCAVATAMCSASCLCCLVEHISTSAGRMASRPCTEPPLEAIPRQLRYKVQYSQGASEASREKFMPFWDEISTILACFPNLFP